MDIPLKSLSFLSIDCQATGSSPKTDHLLEIGWFVFRSDSFQNQAPLSPQASIILPPKNFVLPPRITRLTGIRSSHLQHGVPDASAIETLKNMAKSLARENHLPLCIGIIHYARYEISFLKQIFKKNAEPAPLPFDVICTHQVASRIFPDLPRKGLRAVAGYLGHSMPIHKRCHAHLIATAFIWCKMIEILADREGVHTLGELRLWLKNTKIPAIAKSYPMPFEVRSGLPKGPGVYRMKRSNGDILYIGKATSLKQRINSYFQNSRRHSEYKLEMLTQAKDLDYIVTPTALEAALQETDEIKRIKPPYNIALSSENRHLFFVSRNFDVSSSTRDDTCRLGPVPSASTFAAADKIVRLIDGRLTRLNVPSVLDMPASHCPDEDCFKSGMARFMETYGGVFHSRPHGQAVLHVGRLSWMDRAKEKAARQNQHQDPDQNLDQDDTKEPKAATDFIWTPGTVVKSLESICRRCGFLLRRARWLTILSESTVAWKMSHTDTDRINIIQMTSGRISNRYHCHPSHAIPLPPNHEETIPNRQMNIQLETYDRLRVLTTEMRRLVAEDRLIRIQLGKKRYLAPDDLRVLFSWI